MLTMHKQITIKILKKQGKNNSAIARELNCHRNTVRNILSREKIIEKQVRSKGSYFDFCKGEIEELIVKKNISRLRTYEILDEKYSFNRTYDSLCKYIKKHFPKKIEAFGVQIVDPGEEAEIDFGYLGLLPNNEGGKSKTYVLVIKLSYSRYPYYELTYNQKLETVIHGLDNAFEHFGGVPKKLKVDNMKTAVIRNRKYELEFNQDLLEYSYHYGFVIKPCTPYKPNQKGKVESDIKYVQINFLPGRSFKDRNDLEKQLRDWMINYASKRIHGVTKRIPAVVFETEEKQKLQPLPENKFSFFQRSVRKVKINCHISFKNNYYSVPSHLIGKNVDIRWDKHIIRIIYMSEQVALHHIGSGKGEFISVREHLPSYKCYSETEYQAKYENKMKEIGENAHQYFKQILIKQNSYWFRTIRAILGLKLEYGAEVVEKSLKRAMDFKVFDLSVIKNIIKNKSYMMAKEPILIKTNISVEDLNSNQENASMDRKPAYYLEALN